LSAEIKRGAKSADNGPNEEEDVVEHEYSQRREPIVIIKKLLLSRPITHKARKTQWSVKEKEKERERGVRWRECSGWSCELTIPFN